MKNLLYLAIICTLLYSTSAIAQKQTPLPPDSKPDIELTCEEAEARINDMQNKVDALSKRLKDLNDAVTKSSQDLLKVNQDLADCEKEILALIPATEQDVEAFRQRLGVLEGKVRQMQRLSNDELADRRAEVVALENELNELRANRLSVLPEFFDRIVALARDIRGLYREKKVSGYTVGT